VGFAAQNFAGAGKSRFRLRRLAVNARAVEVEREHLRWTYYFPVSPPARVRLAETLFQMGNASAGIIQLKRALKDREGTAREHFLLAEGYARTSLYAEALAELETVLRLEPGHREARLERPNVLYLANRLLEARDSLREALQDSTLTPGPASWNLLGNTEYALGNWSTSAEAYLKAVEMQPDVPQFLNNAARSLEKGGRGPEAAALYLRAARSLFAEETFDELSLLLPRLHALDPSNPEVRSLEGRMLYREGKMEEAERIFSSLAAEGKADSSVCYLLGIILSAQGRKDEALPLLEKAAAAEPSFPLYQFRLAETLHLLGRDPSPVLDRALALSPDDPWTNNLAGMIRLESGDSAGAVDLLRKAAAAAPTEVDIAINLSEALFAEEKDEEAFAVLDGMDASVGPDARIANQRGNLWADAGDYARAVAGYEEAIRRDPDSPVYKENCAAACIEIDMVHRAEELLSQVERDHPSSSVYNLLGNVAVLKGELPRAELAFTAGLQRDPGNADLSVNLAMLHLQRNAWDKAKEILEAVLARTPDHERARKVLERARSQREISLSCAGCGRSWWAPRDLEAQPGIRVRGEPPADAPAGRCPRCGKIYCVGCASQHIRDMRFYCPDCGEFLKLSEDSLKWLLSRAIDAAAP
jgi:tetratricopeptide (TPR) repeat protein